MPDIADACYCAGDDDAGREAGDATRQHAAAARYAASQRAASARRNGSAGGWQGCEGDGSESKSPPTYI